MEVEKPPLRDYGLGDPAKPIGKPTATKLDMDMPCPNCQCQLMEVKVAVKSPLLKGGKGTGTYLGCPACEFASPMLSTASTT